MATKRTPAETTARPRKLPQPEPERPAPEEVAKAIEEWRDAEHARRIAAELEQDKRVVLVDVLRRAGLKGLVL